MGHEGAIINFALRIQVTEWNCELSVILIYANPFVYPSSLCKGSTMDKVKEHDARNVKCLGFVPAPATLPVGTSHIFKWTY